MVDGQEEDGSMADVVLGSRISPSSYQPHTSSRTAACISSELSPPLSSPPAPASSVCAARISPLHQRCPRPRCPRQCNCRPRRRNRRQAIATVIQAAVPATRSPLSPYSPEPPQLSSPPGPSSQPPSPSERPQAAKSDQRIAKLEEQMKRQEERHTEERQNFMEVMSHNGSNSHHHVSPRSTENVDAHHHDAHFEEDEDCGDNEDHDACPEEGEYLFARRRLVAHTMQFHQHSPTSATHTVQTHAISPHQCTPNDMAPFAQHHAPLSSHRFPNNATPTVQHGAAHEEQPHATSSRQCIPSNVLPAVQPDATHEVQLDAAKQAKTVQPQVGMNVILYEVVRSDAHVALGTNISTNPKTIIGCVALGKQYCEVVVNHMPKRDATLPRTYPSVEKMVDAHRLSIAWSYNRVKQQASKSVRKASKSSQGVSGGGERS
ncbi:uncharacterized protein [Miscanthus floridulus]|uniref:uncharacterized protein n=1 Tax=Miscanthus floridulus TaxID=154761 RepID=UPI003457DE54